MKKSWRNAFNIQLLFNLVLAIFFIILNHKNIVFLLQNLFAFIFLGLFYLTRNTQKSSLQRVRTIYIIALSPLIFITYLRNLIGVLVQNFSQLSFLIAVFYVLSYLLVLIPVTTLYFTKITNTFWRFAAVTYLTITLLLTHSVHFPEEYSFLNNFFSTTILYGFIYLILAYFLMKGWGLKFRPVFKPQILSKSFYVLATFIALFSIWFAFFEPLSFKAYDWGTFFFNWDMSTSIPSWKEFFVGVGAGLFEETERYIILVILLFGFRKMKNGYLLAILVGSLQFSLTHYLNLREPGATFNTVSLQVIYTLGFSILMATLFLYTGQLWLPVLAHFLLDFISFSSPSTGSGFLSLYGNGELLYTAFITIIPLIGALLVIALGNKQLKANARYLIQPRNAALESQLSLQAE
ncbi:CPBP family intramembrane glutamic endopeptidase [Lactobacillus hominis]|uniref:CPBP family intramembrane glutamic endopeptidase n=1 Tax=Lactobacillus hominis TaxID=1203033 RepID=UPI0023F26FF6|nr:CPBP family intramembrane glutamic endopeptidase [Lactobacillus hominis]